MQVPIRMDNTALGLVDYPTDLLKLFGVGVVNAGCHKRYLFFDLFAHFMETPFFKLIVNSIG